MTGLYITFEGCEGSGKSTQIRLLAQRLASVGVAHATTKQPGGTAIGQHIRKVLLHKENADLVPHAESLLYWADRVQHVQTVLLPLLSQGFVVIGDRDADSSIAYQQYARGLDAGWMQQMRMLTIGDFRPTCTILLDGDVEQLLTRSLQKNSGVVAQHGEQADESRFEREQLDFHQRVRDGFLSLAQQHPQRFVVLNALQDVDSLHAQIWLHVKPLLASHKLI